MHKNPIIFVPIVLILLTSCRTKEHIEFSTPILLEQKIVPEHSLDVFLIMYDAKIGKEPLLEAIKEYKCEIIYDYGTINGMALRKPEDKTLEEAMQYFKKVKG